MGRSAEFFAAGTAAVVLLSGCNANAATENPNSGLHSQTVDIGPTLPPVGESMALNPPIEIDKPSGDSDTDAKDEKSDKGDQETGVGEFAVWENPGPNSVLFIDTKSMTGVIGEERPNEQVMLEPGESMEVVCYTAGATALVGVHLFEYKVKEHGLNGGGGAVWASQELTKQLKDNQYPYLPTCKD